MIFHNYYYKGGKSGGYRDEYLNDASLQSHSDNIYHSYFADNNPITIEIGWINTQDKPVDKSFQIVFLKTSTMDYLSLYSNSHPVVVIIILVVIAVCIVILVTAVCIAKKRRDKRIALELQKQQ